MENENSKNYLDERRNLDENNFPNLDSENEIKSGPKKELLGLSGDAEKLKNESNEVVEMMKKKKNKNITIPIILGVVFLVIIIIAGFLLLSNKKIPKVEEKNPQQKILNSSLMAMSDIKSYSFAGDFNLESVNSGHATTRGQTGKERYFLTAKFNGQADESDADNIKSSFNIKPKIAISKEGGSENVSFDLSTKSFGKVGEETAYLKLNDFDLGAAGIMYGKAIMPYKNKWYSLDMKELQKKSGVSKKEDFNPEEMMKKIKELSKKYKMIKFQSDLGDTKLGDADVYHYQVGIDSEAALDFYVEFLKTSPFLTSKLTSGELENFDKELGENREEILAVANEILGNIKTEIWIGKKDGMIYKLAMNGDFDKKFAERLKEKMEEMNKDKYSDSKKMHGNEKGGIVGSREGINDNDIGELSFSATITMSDFNQPVNISKPENTKDLMKVLEEAMVGFIKPGHFPLEENGGSPVEEDSDQDGLSDRMETFYGTDPNNPDTDGDGFSDGDEVNRGYDPLLPGEAKLDYGKMFEEKK